MKKIIILILLSITISIFAQQPEVSFKDLGFTKKVKKIETYSYSFEDKMVEDKSSDSYDLDENGNIIIDSITFTETRGYVEKVLSNYKKYQRIYR